MALFSLPCETAAQEREEDFAMLTAYRDFFSQATDFSLSFIRYRPRGYDNTLRDFRWNNIRLEDWENGRISWSVIGRLSALNSENNSDHIITNIFDRSSTLKLSGSLGNRTYIGRASIEGSIKSRNSWYAMLEATYSGGRSITIDGTGRDSYSLFASVGKKFDQHSIEFSAIYAPSTRATQRASTAEAYSLTGDYLYNSGWGRQNGKRRSARENKTSQPIFMFNHKAQLSPNTELNTTLAARIGMEYRTGLWWQYSPNPYPDYYRYMPSFQKDQTIKDEIIHLWQTDENSRQIDFHNLYAINKHNSPMSKYVIQQYRRDVQQYYIQSELKSRHLSGGFEISYAKNRNYKLIEDLLGGEYWLDIDAWVENDDDVKDRLQNNLHNPNHKAKEGDKFGYDYEMTMRRGVVWVGAEKRWDNIQAEIKGEATATQYQREGFFEKENFAGNQSHGKSAKITNYDYLIKGKIQYLQGGKFQGGFMIDYRTLSPNPSLLFFSKEYRNAILPSSIRQKVTTVELFGDYRSSDFRIKGSLYYTKIQDKTELMTFYDDNIHRYTHYWLKGIQQRHMGIELSAEIDLAENLSASTALVISDNRYTNNPIADQWDESTGDLLREGETVYYKDKRTSGSPQSVAVVSLQYSPKTYHLSLSANFFTHNYISMTPLRRTERTTGGIDKHSQERLSSGLTVDIFAGRNFYFQSGRRLGVWLGVNNILNRKNILTGGYESYRTVDSGASDSRYYYGLGINGFISVSFQL